MRTLTLVGLLGGLSGLLSHAFGFAALALVTLLTTATLIGAAFIDRRKESQPGMTTEMAALVVHILGILATIDLPGIDPTHRWTLVAAGAIATLIILSARHPLHHLADRVSTTDLIAAAKLGVLLVIILPLLPREEVGPIPGIIPFEIGLLISLIAAIGFVAYLGVRIFGSRRGMLITGAIGGLASSTAVTLAFSRRVRETPDLAPPAAAGIVLAAAAMIPRQLIAISIVAPALLTQAALPIAAMGITALAAAALWALIDRYQTRKTPPDPADEPEHTVAMQNPSSLTQALKFGVIFVIVMILIAQARQWFGSAGLYISAVLGGLTDADAITLAVGRMYTETQIQPGPATLALVLGAGTNTLAKALIAAVLAGPRFGLRVLILIGPAVLIGAAIAWFTA